jgi:uncharacterized protein (DUF736 family)
MRIGSFTQDPQGNIIGQISGLGIGIIPVELQSQVSRNGNPFFKIIAEQNGEPYEVGAAFPKQKDGRTYYSVNMDSPVFAVPVNAAMFYDQKTGTYNLVWDRPAPLSLKQDAEGALPRHLQTAKPNVQAPTAGPTA